MKVYYDKNRKDLDLNPGDMVLLSTKSHKLLAGYRKHRQRYVGPYVVRRKINDNAYQLSGLPPGVPKTQSVKFLALFRPSPVKFQTRPTPQGNVPDVVDGSAQYEVEKIVDDRVTRGSYRFAVKWAHMNITQWLPMECLTNCNDLLRDYYALSNRTVPQLVAEFIERVEKERQDRQSDDESIASSSDDDQRSLPDASSSSEEEDDDD